MIRSLILSTVVAILLLSPLIPISGGGSTDAVIITHFKDGSDSVKIVFTGAGTDTDTAKLEIAPNSTVENATMRVRAGPDGSGNYPWNVSVDVGGDDDNEWRFAGEGYGRLGNQEFFNDSLGTKFVSIGSPGAAQEIFVRLPAGASIDHASMELEPYGVNYPLDKSPPTGMSTNSPTGATRGLKFTCNSPNIYVTELGVLIPPAYASSSQRWVTLFDFSTQQKMAQAQISPVTGGQWCFQQLPSPVGLTQGSQYVVAEWGTGYYYGASGMPSPWNGDSHITYLGTQYANSGTKDTFPTSFLNMVYGIPDIGYSFGGGGIDDVELNVGPKDGSAEWEFPGTLSAAVNTGDLSAYFNTFLGSASPSGTDGFGNDYVDVPINISAGAQGALMVRNLTVKYDFEALIEVNPKGDLAKEINQHLPPDASGNITIPIAVRSDSAGEVTLFDLNLSYNGAPWFLSGLPTTLECHEDIAEPRLLDLSLWVADDNQDPGELGFRVHSNSHDEVVDVAITDGCWLGADPSVSPDWNSESTTNGLVEVKVSITDGQNRTVVSPMMFIEVLAMNDEPYASQDIPDIVMEEGTTDSSVVLNSQPYFSDIEFDTLHYSAVVDPLGTVEGSRHNLSAEVDELSRALEVRAPGDFFTAEGSPVPVWVYCDDDTRVNTIEDGYLDEGGLVPNWTHQEVLVTVINVNDDPVWDDIPDLVTDEDTPVYGAVLLKDYVTDIDSPPETWEFKLRSNSNKRLKVTLDGETSALNLVPAPNAHGTARLEVEVSDGEDEAKTDLKVVVRPVNDRPTLEVFDPREGSAVMGNVTFTGTADDVEKALARVECTVGDAGVWTPLETTQTWSFVLDTAGYPNGPLAVTFRAFDGELFSQNLTVNVTVDNPVNLPPAVLILSPGQGQVVPAGIMTVIGSSSDTDGAVKKIKLQLGDDPNLIVIKDQGPGLAQWSYELNNTQWAGEELTIRATASDGRDLSPTVNVTFSVAEVPGEEDGGDGDVPAGLQTANTMSLNWLWILIAAAVAGAAAGVFVLLLFMRKKREEEREEEERRREEEEEEEARKKAGVLDTQLRIAGPGAGPQGTGWTADGSAPAPGPPGQAVPPPPPPPTLPPLSYGEHGGYQPGTGVTPGGAAYSLPPAPSAVDGGQGTLLLPPPPPAAAPAPPPAAGPPPQPTPAGPPAPSAAGPPPPASVASPAPTAAGSPPPAVAGPPPPVVVSAVPATAAPAAAPPAFSTWAPPAAAPPAAGPGTLPPPPASPAVPLEVNCYACGGKVPVTSDQRPLLITCPSCGARGEI